MNNTLIATSLALLTASLACADDFPTKKYPAKPLLEVKDADGEVVLEPDQLVEVLMNWVGEDAWDDPAEIKIGQGLLVVKQLEKVQAEIERALSELKRAIVTGKPRSLEEWRKHDAKEAEAAAKKLSKADKAVHELLKRKVTLNFPGTPLGEVISFVKDITGAKVEVIGDLADELDSIEVKVKLRDVTLREALDRILGGRPDGIRWRVDQGALIIGLPEDLPERLFARIYDARAFNGQKGALGPEELIEGLEEHALSDEGSLELLGGVLIVRASRARHEKLMKLLEQAAREPDSLRKKR